MSIYSNKNPYILLGAGGHAKVIFDLLQITKQEVLGICSPNPDPSFTSFQNFLESEIEKMNPKKVFLANCIGSTKTTQLRSDLYLKFKKMRFHFPALIHPSAFVSPSAMIAEGCQIMAGCILQSGSVLEENVILNTGSQIDHDCFIGESSHIAPGCILSGNVRIGKNCHIGTGSIFIQNIVVGQKALIGAGSIIKKNIEINEKFINRP